MMARVAPVARIAVASPVPQSMPASGMVRFAPIALVALALSGCHEVVELDPRSDMSAAGPTHGADTSAEPTEDAAVGWDATDAAPEGSASCRPAGASCTTAAECCSGLCDPSGHCALPDCVPLGGACASAAECCSALCAGGICAPSGMCLPAGEVCTSGSSCCSGVCVSDGTRQVCQSLGGCAVAGEVCRSDAQCCSGRCTLLDSTTGLGRCEAPSGCASVGEICNLTGNPHGARECCPGGPMTRGLCAPTSVDGVSRCRSARDGSACIGEGRECASPEDCCVGSCVPEAGTFRCRAACRPEGTACTRGADCCSGACLAGVCGASDRSCAPLGAACTSSAACCSGFCSPATSVCAARG